MRRIRCVAFVSCQLVSIGLVRSGPLEHKPTVPDRSSSCTHLAATRAGRVCGEWREKEGRAAVSSGCGVSRVSERRNWTRRNWARVAELAPRPTAPFSQSDRVRSVVCMSLAARGSRRVGRESRAKSQGNLQETMHTRGRKYGAHDFQGSC